MTLKTMKELVDDPFFEFTFEMLNDDDKMEFPDIGEEIHKKRVRHRQAHDREQNKRRKMAAPRQPVRLPVTGGVGPPAPAPLPPGPDPAPPPVPRAPPLPPRGARVFPPRVLPLRAFPPRMRWAMQ